MTAPASLPHLGLVLGASSTGSVSAPAPLPHLGLLLTGVSHALSAESGTYSLSGQDAGLIKPTASSPATLPHLGLLGGLGNESRRLAAEVGAYSLTGQAAGGLKGYRLAADRGTFGVQGQVGILQASLGRAGDPAPLPHLGLLLAPVTLARTLPCDTGIYSIAGSEVLLDHELDSDVGAYTITGQAADLRTTRRLVAESGVYDLTGSEALFSRTGAALSMLAQTGFYDLSGVDAETVVGRTIGAEHGFYSLSGQSGTILSVGLAPVYHLTAESGEYTVTGTDSDTYYGGSVLFAECGFYELRGFPEVEPIRAAGRSSSGIAVERNGRVEFFDTEEQARKWLQEQLPTLEKKVKKAAKRIAKQVVQGGEPEPYAAPVINAPPSVMEVVLPKLAKLESTFNDQLEAEKRRLEQEEEEAAALLLM